MNNVTTIILYFLSPVIGLFNTIIRVKKNNYNAVYFYAFFLGLIALLTGPAGDMYRHSIIFDRCISKNGLILSVAELGDFIVPSVYYFFNLFKIPFDFCRFLFQIVSTVINIYIYIQLAKESKSVSRLFWLFVISQGFLGFLGVRSPLATSFALLGYYLQYYREKYIRALFLYILASSTHYFFIPLSVIFFIGYFIPNIKPRKIFIVPLAIACAVFGFFIISNFAGSFFDDKMGYIDGYWGKDHESSFNNKVFQLIIRIPLLILFLFFYKTQNCSFRVRNSIFVFSFCSLACYNLEVIFSRVSPCLSAMLMMYYYQNSKIASRLMNRAIIMSLILACFSFIYSQRDYYRSDNNAYIELFFPLPYALSHIFNSSWIANHIDDNGDFINRTH